jgi:hypothetical protein
MILRPGGVPGITPAPGKPKMTKPLFHIRTSPARTVELTLGEMMNAQVQSS